MKKSRRTYNGVHLNKKSNTQDVVEQSLTVKYSPSTMVLNLNGLFILRFFFNATFFANIRNIFEFILKDWLK